MTPSKYLNSVLTVIALLLALNLWVGAHQSPVAAAMDPSSEALAQGRIDAGQQRAEMIKELRLLGSKVDSMSKKLSDGSIKIKIEDDH